VKGLKPDDVSPSHWAKIVDITKKSMKKQAAGTSRQGASERNIVDSEDGMDTDSSHDSEVRMNCS